MAKKKIDPQIAIQMRKEGMLCAQIAERFGVNVSRVSAILRRAGMTNYEPNMPRCKSNIGVNCDGKGCESCGWNPEVKKRRVLGFNAKNGLLREVMRFE